MRVELILSKNKSSIPINYNYMLVGIIHRLLGKNNKWHDMPYSPYTFSYLRNTYMRNKAIHTVEGESKLIICSMYEEFIDDIIEGIKRDNTLFCGVTILRVDKVELDYDRESFYAASPIFTRERIYCQDREKEIENYYTYLDNQANAILLDLAKRKMACYGVSYLLEKIEFDTTYKAAKTKLIHFKDNKIHKRTIHERIIKASLCPVLIKGSKEAKQFLCETGIGQLTGLGLGCLT